MTTVPKVQIIPLISKTETLVKKHGDTMFLLKKEPGKILVESLKKTWEYDGKFFTWVGWFRDTEASWKEI